MALAVALFAGALIGSVLAAQRLPAKTASGPMAFVSSAEATAAALTAALQHEEDLVVSARVYIGGDAEGPNETERGFLRGRIRRSVARYPEIEGGGEVQFVVSFSGGGVCRGANAEPATVRPTGTVRPPPPGRGPYYCLVSLSFARRIEPATAEPPGLDYCSVPSLRTAFIEARDSGRNEYVPFRSGDSRADRRHPDLPRQRHPGDDRRPPGPFRGVFGTTIVPR